MTLGEIIKLLNAEILYGTNLLSREISSVFCCDLLSDVLAFTGENVLLLTGLTNLQVIYTANMINAAGVVFVRGKIPSEEIINLAKEMELPIFSTPCLMFETCGILYSRGISGSV